LAASHWLLATIFIGFVSGAGMGVRVEISYWLLAISYWQLFLSGFVSGAGMGVRVEISYWLLAISYWQLFLSGFVSGAGMGVRVEIGGRRKTQGNL
jgi:hypothetical protein